MTSKNNYVAVFGQANSKPIIMTLSKTDGSIRTFFTLDLISPGSTTPNYVTLNGFYYEEQDPTDKNAYVYLSFSMNS